MIKPVILSALLLTMASPSFSQEENWDVYMANYEKGVGSTVLNMSYKTRAPLKTYPFLLITGVTFTDCDTSGLPVVTAFKQLYAISDKIKTAIDYSYSNKFVGTFTYQCERVDYYYLTDTSNIRNRLDSIYKNNFPDLKPIIKLREDSKWEAYLSFLYPNEETLEYMSNEKVVLHLLNAGDDLTKPRKVDHWIYFNNSADRDKFTAYVAQNKYTIESKSTSKEFKLPYQLQISRTDYVDMESITKITLELRKKALECKGDYDGWETEVIK